MTLKRFGVSLEADLLEKLDIYALEYGFSNRSQTIRFLIEKNITETKWRCNHTVAGTLTLIYPNCHLELVSDIVQIELENKPLILSSGTHYLSNELSLHTVNLLGQAHMLTSFSDKLITLKGIKHGKLSMSRAD